MGESGPFTVWQMFNAPTMVLFNNLDNAADGLERLLMSILKLSGDFSEVFVPRPGTSRYPDEYYKSFNNWLIGRLFYIWSVDDLNRIHISSKDAQIKILNILYINGALFYENLHQDYIEILFKLIDFLKENSRSNETKTIILEYFISKQIDVPDVQLDLKPIFVKVDNLEVCKKLIEMTLQLLSKSIPMDIFNTDKNISQYKITYTKIIYLLENFDIDYKVYVINFFACIIKNYSNIAINKFNELFPSINTDVIKSTEVFLELIPIYYEKGELDDYCLERINKAILSYLQVVHYEINDKQSMANIISTVLQTNTKVLSKELRGHILTLTTKIEVPNNMVMLQNLHPNEIQTVSDYYVTNILEYINTQDCQIILKENEYYRQCINILTSIKVEDCMDNFLLSYHINRISNILQILLKVHVIITPRKEIKVMTKQEGTLLMNLILNIFDKDKNNILRDIECFKNINNIILSIVIISKLEKQFEGKLDLTQTVNLENELAILNLKELLLKMIIFQSTMHVWSNRVVHVLNELLKVKSLEIYKQLIPLSPLLIISNTILPSKLIGDILMPAFLMKDTELQKILYGVLPIVTCISLGNCVVILNSNEEEKGHSICINDKINLIIVCSKCHNKDRVKENDFLNKIKIDNYTIELQWSVATNVNTVAGQRSLFAKFLKYEPCEEFNKIVECFSNHTIFNNTIAAEIFNENNMQNVMPMLRMFSDNIEADENIENSQKEVMFSTCINLLVNSTKTSLLNNDYDHQTLTLNCIRDCGLSHNNKVLLPTTKLLVYFIMHPQCSLGAKAVVYLRDICEGHNFTPNQVYHRYKKDYCKLFVDCCLYSEKQFSLYLLKVVRAFGFVGYRDFISKDVHHFLPYLVPYSVKFKEVTTIIEEIASLVQCSVSDFLIERFPHVYTHIYLHENDVVAKKCYGFIESLTKVSVLNLIKRHFRVILTEFLLQYCCNPEKVLNACRYLACHDPDESTPIGNMKMSTSQIADFLQPKFLGVLAYFDHKLVNSKVALSVKKKALQSFPHIIKLIGVKHLTNLRFKVLTTLRSALSLVNEFPQVVAAAWSAFISNIDTRHLGPMLPNLAVSLLQQFEHAPSEINKIFQYLVLKNENLLSAHIPDLFFLNATKISEKVRVVIKGHVKRTMPDGFLDKVKWFLQYLSKDIPNIKEYAFTYLERLMRENRTEIHKAIFGGKNIDPVIVELIECLLVGCKDPHKGVSISSGACLGELGALEAGHLPRQYVQPDRSPFAFSIVEDCFAATALVELTRACQYEKDTMNYHCYALTIQEILKIYNISPNSSKKQLWDSFPEHMHQIMDPLLRSRYTLACPSKPKTTHPLFGSAHAATFLEWAHNWTGQLIPLIVKENIRELLRTVHPSMRRDVRTLFLFLPYVLLHAIMSQTKAQYIQEEMLAVIGLESFQNENKVNFERNKYKLLRHIRLTPSISSTEAEECNQNKCCKMIYTLLDFLNRWLLEWLHNKQNPTMNEDYKSISSFLEKFDKLTIAKGNFICGEYERALQYLELYMDESKDQMQTQLPFLAEIYAVLDEPDSVAGILSMQRTEPSLKQLILAQIVTGRLQDAALCYERLAQEGQLDRHGLQGMIECYLGLDQPFTAYRLLNDLEVGEENMMELAAEPLWRLGRFEELDELVKTPVPPSRENWGLLMGRILLSFRSQDRDAFQVSCKDGMSRLLSQMNGEGKSESALRNDYQTVFGLHVIKEATHVDNMLHRLKHLPDGGSEGSDILNQLVEDWRRRAAIVQSDVRSMEPLLRCRRILLSQTQEMLQSTHPLTAEKLKSCIGDLWLQSAKHARKAGIFQQAYMYILNAEEYHPEELFIEKAKMYWERKQPEHAFTTLRRGLEEAYPQIDNLTREQRKRCAKAKLLIAKYNDETTSVDVDVNIGYYKEAVDVCKQWEKSLVSLGAYYEKVSSGDNGNSSTLWTRRIYALNSYGKALQYGHKYLYQSMPRMLSIWLDDEKNSSDANMQSTLTQMTEIIKTYSERLPSYLYLTAFSQIVSRICHPAKEVYLQLKAIIIKLILAYPQHTLWMMMCIIKSSYPQRIKRCSDVLQDARLKEPAIVRLIGDFTQLAEMLIELCNKPIGTNASTTTVSSLVRPLPRLLASSNFSHIMIPFQEFCKIVLPSKAACEERLDFNIPTQPPVYIAGIEENITILPSLQKPRKVTLKGSDGKSYIIMLKPRDDLRKDYRLMEFNGVVNRFLQDAPETRKRRLYIRTYCVLPLNEECGLIEWVPNLLGLRPIVTHIYKQRGISTSNRELREMICSNKDPVEKKRRIYLEQLLPRHPPVFQEWFRRIFSDPYGWYQARSAYIRTTAVISMVGYILGLGDRHGENISFDSTNGDTVHVDFNCLFNKGEAFEWPERVPFRLTHNMEAAMGPLKHEGMFRKSCEVVMRALREQTAALMSVIGPFVYDPLVSWGRVRPTDCGERTNEQALQNLLHIRQRLNGMVRTKNKQLSLSLSPEGQVEHLIVEATSINNLCQMYMGWGPFL